MPRVVQHVTNFNLLEYSMEEIKFVPLSATCVIAYKLAEKGSAQSKESPTVYASAVWVERGGKWVCVFSQETPEIATSANSGRNQR